MDKLAVVLAVVAIGLGAYAVFGSNTDATDGYATPVTDLETRIAALEAENAEYRKLLGVGEGMTASANGSTDAGALEGRSHLGVPRRVAELESRLADYEKRFTAMEEKSNAASSPARWTNHMPAFASRKFLANADMASKELELDSSQRAQLDRVIESTKRELDDLYATANDDGVTLKDLMKPPKLSKEDLEGGAIRIFNNFGKIRKFKQGKVPGTNETYAEAEKRILKAGKQDARGLMNEEQAKKWDNSHTDHMFRSGGAAPAAVSIAFEEVIESPSDK